MTMFRRDRGCCGSEVATDGCVSSGVPMESVGVPVGVGGATVVTPGASSQSGTLGPSTPSDLEPLPKADPGPAPGAVRPRSGSGTPTRSSYETQRPYDRSKRSRNDNMAHTLISTPVPTVGSAQDSTGVAARDTTAASSDNDSVLDHLPPLDLPSDVTEKSATPPVAPAAERKPSAPAAASDRFSSRSPQPSELTLTGSIQPAPDPASTAGGAPGISRFVAVDLRLAAGSVPSKAGLDWLAEKGYKTLVDLRESSEGNLSLIAEATSRGLRYIPLPITLRSIDADHVARFQFELSLTDARPLYFFDGDGTRAGALWYIRRIGVDRVSREVAHREAEEIGLSNPDFWLAATNYLERVDQKRATTPVPPSQASTPAPEKPAGTAAKSTSTTAPGSVTPDPTEPGNTPAKPAPSQALLDGPIQTAAQDAVPPPYALDPDAWQPYASMLVTGLAFPLAYVSRTIVPTILERTRASLPAAARQPRSLPYESGV
jgi:protein tyrosine phosphatase (PTP) superfamily phosphohydrolase (DUF442 family)